MSPDKIETGTVIRIKPFRFQDSDGLSLILHILSTYSQDLRRKNQPFASMTVSRSSVKNCLNNFLVRPYEKIRDLPPRIDPFQEGEI